MSRPARTYEHYECPDCMGIWTKDQIKEYEECPRCKETCELKRECDKCFREMDADYDNKTWTCTHCNITIMME
jgi:DNA-directed RNA polymerase subunit RPC12/RpoP